MFTKWKKTIMIIWTLTILSLFIFVMYDYKNIESSTIKEKIDLLIRNNSWESPFSDSVPYKKWDEIELNLILKGDYTKEIKLNTEKLKLNFKIKSIYIWDKEVSDWKNIDVKKWEKIKIIVEALDNWVIKKDENQDIVEIIKEEENKEEEKKEEEKVTEIPSSNVSLNNYNINWNINNLIEILWDWRNYIDYVNIWWVSLKPVKSDDNKVFLSINQNTFTAWEYFVIVQFSDGTIQTLNEKIKFDFSEAKVNVSNITPNQIKNDIDRYIVIQWNWLSKVISIQLNNNIILKNTSFDVISDNVLSVKIPKELVTWKYYFNIMTTDGIYEIKNKTFNIN